MRRTALKALVLFVAVTAVAQERDTSVAEAWLDGKSGAVAKQLAEATLAACHPPATSAGLPVSCFAASDAVAGYWVGGSDPGDCLRVRAAPSGGHVVAYLADSHDAIFRFRRAAVLQGNVLSLAGPVMDADQVCFERLYVVTSEGKRWLIPAPTVPEVATFVQSKGCAALAPNWIRGNMFQPASADAAAICQDALKVQK
jgi:hypothetical protein